MTDPATNAARIAENDKKIKALEVTHKILKAIRALDDAGVGDDVFRLSVMDMLNHIKPITPDAVDDACERNAEFEATQL